MGFEVKAIFSVIDDIADNVIGKLIWRIPVTIPNTKW